MTVDDDGYVEPPWRAAESAEAYVTARLTSKDADADLKALLDMVVKASLKVKLSDQKGEHDDEALIQERREHFIWALVCGVERAKTVHDRLDYEDEQKKLAVDALEYIKKLEKWIEEFNSPRFTIREQLGPYEPPKYDAERLMTWATHTNQFLNVEHAWEELRDIDNRLVAPAFHYLKERMLHRIAIAENRRLAGATRQFGGKDKFLRDEAAVRFGMGVMGREMTWAWTPSNKDLEVVGLLIKELFSLPDTPDIEPSQIRASISASHEIYKAFEDEGAWEMYY
jgi:hypothetical protein